MLESIIAALNWIEEVIINGILGAGFAWIISIIKLF